MKEGATQSCPSSHTISGHPVCTRTGSSSHPGVPCLCPSMPKIPRIPRRLPHRVFCSPERQPYLSTFTSPLSPLSPRHRNLLLPPPALTTTSGFLSPHPNRRQNISIASLSCDLGAICLHQGSRRLPPTPYPRSFSHTSYIRCNANPSATMVYQWSIYLPTV